MPPRLPILLAACAAISCHRAPPAIDHELASCIPPGTVVLAGVDLDRLRPTPLFATIAPAVSSLREASNLLIASSGQDLLFLARGNFTAAPAGATLMSKGLAAMGTPDTVRAAIAQYRTGTSGSPRLVELASSIPPGRQMWLVAQGGITLPLTGNAANLNRILHLTESITLSAQVDAAVRLDATGQCPSPEGARQLEESLRAILTLAGVAARRQPDLAQTLQAIEIRRDDRTVRAGLSTTPENAAKLIRALAP